MTPRRRRRRRGPARPCVVEEVGRDPLRIPRSTPPEATLETARRLAAARARLAKVLPQPQR